MKGWMGRGGRAIVKEGRQEDGYGGICMDVRILREELDQGTVFSGKGKPRNGWMDGERGVQDEDGRKACLSVCLSVCLSAEQAVLEEVDGGYISAGGPDMPSLSLSFPSPAMCTRNSTSFFLLSLFSNGTIC